MPTEQEPGHGGHPFTRNERWFLTAVVTAILLYGAGLFTWILLRTTCP